MAEELTDATKTVINDLARRLKTALEANEQLTSLLVAIVHANQDDLLDDTTRMVVAVDQYLAGPEERKVAVLGCTLMGLIMRYDAELRRSALKERNWLIEGEQLNGIKERVN